MDTTNSDLTVTNLGKIYPIVRSGGASAVAGIAPISFTLRSGTFFTLLGPSGCGKTTTLRCIAGLETPDEGKISLGDTVLFDSRAGISVPLNRRNVGMVFQSYAIWPHMTVFENVAFPLRVARDHSYSSDEIKRLVGEALETVSLGAYGSRSATQLSGGQQQRVALARAIVRRPRLLLLDEPLSNLDAMLRDEMRLELKRLQSQIGVTTVYVTHDQTEALEMSDTIAVLNQGRLVQLGSPRDIYYRPADAFVADFVGSTNLFHGALAATTAANELATVRLKDGQVLSCTFPNPATASDAVAVSVRPENISLMPPNAPERSGWNRVSGKVISSGFLGSTSRYKIKAGDFELQANVPSEHTFAEGQDVAIEFPFENSIGVRLHAPAGSL